MLSRSLETLERLAQEVMLQGMKETEVEASTSSYAFFMERLYSKPVKKLLKLVG